jgi:hypothetical protein
MSTDSFVIVFFYQSNRRTIMDDPFIRNYIEDLLKNIRTQVLLKLIKPYTRIRIPFISQVSIDFCISTLSLLAQILYFSWKTCCSPPNKHHKFNAGTINT